MALDDVLAPTAAVRSKASSSAAPTTSSSPRTRITVADAPSAPARALPPRAIRRLDAWLAGRRLVGAVILDRAGTRPTPELLDVRLAMARPSWSAPGGHRRGCKLGAGDSQYVPKGIRDHKILKALIEKGHTLRQIAISSPERITIIGIDNNYVCVPR